jgi:hypothetical protein
MVPAIAGLTTLHGVAAAYAALAVMQLDHATDAMPPPPASGNLSAPVGREPFTRWLLLVLCASSR